MGTCHLQSRPTILQCLGNIDYVCIEMCVGAGPSMFYDVFTAYSTYKRRFYLFNCFPSIKCSGNKNLILFVLYNMLSFHNDPNVPSLLLHTHTHTHKHTFCHKGLVTNYVELGGGGGGYTTGGGGGKSSFTPAKRRGAEKVLVMLKGGQNKF